MRAGLLELPLSDNAAAFDAASSDLRFAAAVASFGMILRELPHKRSSSFDSVLSIAEGSRGEDRDGYRNEFIRLVRTAQHLQ